MQIYTQVRPLGADKEKAFLRILVLIAYAVIVFVGVLNHEYWFDEAQAWNIARDNSISGIFSFLKYEGHPPLWFLLLHVLTSLGLPCEAMGFFCWGLSVLSAAMILFLFPVKPYFKAAMIFCSGMLFVNSIIARSYCLINFLLCVIAVIYPKRKAHPLLFGLLIALIANTHLCMSGLAGILGLYMLIDLIKDWKSVGKKQNIFNVLGIVIAAAGAAFLVLPLLESLSSNNFAANSALSFDSAVKSILKSPLIIILCCVAPNLSGIPIDIMTAVAELCLFASIIVMRHKKRIFIIALTFILFYIAVCEVVWYSTPNRASVFVFTLAAVFVMGQTENREAAAVQNAPKLPEKPKKGESVILRLLYKMKLADAKPDKTVSVLLAVLLALTVPSGVKYYIQDMNTEFVPSKSAARYLKENMGENDLVVTYGDDASQIIAYLPDVKFYSIAFNTFYSYNFHTDPEGTSDYSEFCRIAADYDNIYYVSRSGGSDIWNIAPLYESFEYVPFVLGQEQVRIWRVTEEELKIWFDEAILNVRFDERRSL